VVYRETSKQEWLGIEAKTIKSAGVVSARIAREMVRAALTKTPEADFGVAITGNLFPTNSKETARLQGVCYIAFGGRNRASVSVKKVTLPKQKKERVKPSLLSQGISTKESSQAWVRTKCQLLASQALLRMVRSMLARQG
jgi:nicotinamide mononucleotide (NMN) deamidase PncC